uniref:Accumulation-associated protein n=1 Tax=Junco hyemalis TaxID=40217 RepID=A0A8C5ILN4_JUNHY
MNQPRYQFGSTPTCNRIFPSSLIQELSPFSISLHSFGGFLFPPGRPTSPRGPAAAPKTSPGRPFGPGAPGAPDFPVRPGCPCSPGSPFGPLSPLGPVKPTNKTGTRHHRVHYKCWSSNPRCTNTMFPSPQMTQ